MISEGFEIRQLAKTVLGAVAEIFREGGGYGLEVNLLIALILVITITIIPGSCTDR